MCKRRLQIACLKQRPTGPRFGTRIAKGRCMRTHRLLLPLCLVAVSCDRDEPVPLREGHAYLQPSGPGRQPALEQRVPQGAQATGDAETRSGEGVAGGESPTSGDHVGAGGHGGGNPSGAPTAGGSGRPQEKK
jgi:hypothetical protein